MSLLSFAHPDTIGFRKPRQSRPSPPQTGKKLTAQETLLSPKPRAHCPPPANLRSSKAVSHLESCAAIADGSRREKACIQNPTRTRKPRASPKAWRAQSRSAILIVRSLFEKCLKTAQLLSAHRGEQARRAVVLAATTPSFHKFTSKPSTRPLPLTPSVRFTTRSQSDIFLSLASPALRWIHASRAHRLFERQLHLSRH